ncbi:MAG: adenylate/guanylate cyclase domain-containing protein [Candidatus Marinimicrobia bacterium]|nr:adenylate/guanylate cyclase domain-containing protein [Candidatus Neomarinimicrobiota bacterium]
MPKPKPIDFHWVFEMNGTPPQLWPLVSDTHAFNRVTGLPPWRIRERPDPLGGSIREVSMRIYGVNLRWRENPFGWVKPHSFSVLREYENGPILSMFVQVELQDMRRQGLGQTRLHYSVTTVPRRSWYRAVILFQLGVISRRRFSRAFARISDYVAEKVADPYPQPEGQISRKGTARLEAGMAELSRKGYDGELLSKFKSHIRNAPIALCDRMGAYMLARSWAAPPKAVLRLFLEATRQGILELSWDIMCPACRGAKKRSSSLADLRSEAHCPSCNISFDANFDQLVEVTFNTAAEIRPANVASYCVGGPWATRHILVQDIVGPAGRHDIKTNFAVGTYRLRSPQVPGNSMLEVEPQTAAAPHAPIGIIINPDGFQPEQVTASEGPLRFVVENRLDRAVPYLIEDASWTKEVVTAADITSLQEFRDIFSSEALAPDEQFAIRNLTFLFTDIKSSTAMYQERGDSPAYRLVRDHFEILFRAVRESGGAVVKTIGDAVMAVFQEPADALSAAVAIQRQLPSDEVQLTLRVGIHAGPCVAITLNDRLDYFGTTVNTAVRLESQGKGGDIVLTRRLLEDSGIEQALRAIPHQRSFGQAELKGLAGQTPICHIRLEEQKIDPKGGLV